MTCCLHGDACPTSTAAGVTIPGDGTPYIVHTHMIDAQAGDTIPAYAVVPGSTYAAQAITHRVGEACSICQGGRL